ncbi:MAG: GIY-YIG nuclease family protein [Planctomycetia bacterium]
MPAPVAQALAAARLWSCPELFLGPDAPPARAGLYGWWLDDVPAPVPVAACERDGPWTLLYVGIAPSAPRAHGAPSRATLRSRLRQHTAGNAEGSTLRLTLGCLLADGLGLALEARGARGRLGFGAAGEQRLSAWMARHARVRWVEDAQPWLLEEQLLRALDLPLNLDGNEHHPFHGPLSHVRAQARQRARAGWRAAGGGALP